MKDMDDKTPIKYVLIGDSGTTKNDNRIFIC